jgi:hypothetical protein
LGIYSVKAQLNDKLEAKQLIAKNNTAIGLTADQLSNAMISDTLF